jgi:hypothetical protein
MPEVELDRSSARLAFRDKPNSRLTVLAIEQALKELGIHAKLSDIVAKAQFIEKEINESRSRRKREHMC